MDKNISLLYSKTHDSVALFVRYVTWGRKSAEGEEGRLGMNCQGRRRGGLLHGKGLQVTMSLEYGGSVLVLSRLSRENGVTEQLESLRY